MYTCLRALAGGRGRLLMLRARLRAAQTRVLRDVCATPWGREPRKVARLSSGAPLVAPDAGAR